MIKTHYSLTEKRIGERAKIKSNLDVKVRLYSTVAPKNRKEVRKRIKSLKKEQEIKNYLKVKNLDFDRLNYFYTF